MRAVLFAVPVLLWLFGIITFLISVGAGALADSTEREEKEDEN